MQSVPESVQLDKIQEELQTVKGVHSVHEFHVWQVRKSIFRDSKTHLKACKYKINWNTSYWT
jgi:Co/Zn/Cd efflux system component